MQRLTSTEVPRGPLRFGSARTTAAVRGVLEQRPERLAKRASREMTCPPNRGEVEAADAGARCAHKSEATTLHQTEAGGRSCGGRVSQVRAIVAG
jgi:hypothetical protein